MRSLSRLDLVCALARRAPFSELGLLELQLVCQHMSCKFYPAGSCIVASQCADDVSSANEILYILLEGSWSSAQRPVPKALANVPAVLFGSAQRQDLHAGPQGAVCAHLARGHLLSLLRSFPRLALAMSERAVEDCPALEEQAR